ncbi:hypothetical protein CONCODRAFT_71146 [Conidiobolus coronatus NRRL 28638]|uniref:Uncharacterized protein n=1 Tax=Conidiobolus coronatus (strain ATCC 28846 / CBS 209.66 / NRRL 28638) TaxID=796925 RepID=A0A137P4J4_CONC2|nr:hypothetical protein CONCODRAFT_71146 [Conidiobolus coronatus NRRL 28638]|eukprot:KXN69851.1 hypothetical protein CONCODRAFT_71146 [Conidiobolus coronatus NRRL 28638]
MTCTNKFIALTLLSIVSSMPLVTPNLVPGLTPNTVTFTPQAKTAPIAPMAPTPPLPVGAAGSTDTSQLIHSDTDAAAEAAYNQRYLDMHDRIFNNISNSMDEGPRAHMGPDAGNQEIDATGGMIVSDGLARRGLPIKSYSSILPLRSRRRNRNRNRVAGWRSRRPRRRPSRSGVDHWRPRHRHYYVDYYDDVGGYKDYSDFLPYKSYDDVDDYKDYDDVGGYKDYSDVLPYKSYDDVGGYKDYDDVDDYIDYDDVGGYKDYSDVLPYKSYDYVDDYDDYDDVGGYKDYSDVLPYKSYDYVDDYDDYDDVGGYKDYSDVLPYKSYDDVGGYKDYSDINPWNPYDYYYDEDWDGPLLTEKDRLRITEENSENDDMIVDTRRVQRAPVDDRITDKVTVRTKTFEDDKIIMG